jgi:hypothetical protein
VKLIDTFLKKLSHADTHVLTSLKAARFKNLKRRTWLIWQSQKLKILPAITFIEEAQ